MNREQFKSFWKLKYDGISFNGHELRVNHNEYWLRIHSLPDSKRYANSEKEYQIIFERQNQIIEDVIGKNEKVVLLYSLFTDDLANENYKRIKEFSEFIKVNRLGVFDSENEEKYFQDIYIKETKWEVNMRNDILKAIADDEIRLMLISKVKRRIIYLYDGGVDLILDSKDSKLIFKEKYFDWLSFHPKGI